MFWRQAILEIIQGYSLTEFNNFIESFNETDIRLTNDILDEHIRKFWYNSPRLLLLYHVPNDFRPTVGEITEYINILLIENIKEIIL